MEGLESGGGKRNLHATSVPARLVWKQAELSFSTMKNVLYLNLSSLQKNRNLATRVEVGVRVGIRLVSSKSVCRIV